MKMPSEKLKQCQIRLNADTHRTAKIQAYIEGTTLQSWINNLITEKINQVTKKDEK